MSFSDDLLEGAVQIGDFLFGQDPSPAAKLARQRRVYRLTTVVAPKDRLPVFRIGSSLFARKSTLLQWVADREAQPRPDPPVQSVRRYPRHLPERYRC